MRARLPSIAKGLIQFECGTDTTVGAIPVPNQRLFTRLAPRDGRQGGGWRGRKTEPRPSTRWALKRCATLSSIGRWVVRSEFRSGHLNKLTSVDHLPLALEDGCFLLGIQLRPMWRSPSTTCRTTRKATNATPEGEDGKKIPIGDYDRYIECTEETAAVCRVARSLSIAEALCGGRHQGAATDRHLQ